MDAEKLYKALSCVCIRLRMFDMGGLREEQQRYLRHTHDIAKAAIDEANGKAEGARRG